MIMKERFLKKYISVNSQSRSSQCPRMTVVLYPHLKSHYLVIGQEGFPLIVDQ